MWWCCCEPVEEGTCTLCDTATEPKQQIQVTLPVDTWIPSDRGNLLVCATNSCPDVTQPPDITAITGTFILGRVTNPGCVWEGWANYCRSATHPTEQAFLYIKFEFVAPVFNPLGVEIETRFVVDNFNAPAERTVWGKTYPGPTAPPFDCSQADNDTFPYLTSDFTPLAGTSNPPWRINTTAPSNATAVFTNSAPTTAPSIAALPPCTQ